MLRNRLRIRDLRDQGFTLLASTTCYLAILLLVACANGGEITAPDDEVRLAGQFTLAPGQTKRVEGTDVTVRFVRLVGDSRCPPGVACVWEGDAEIELELSANGNQSLVRLHSHQGPRFPSEVSFAGYLVRLIHVRPEPANPPRPQSDYRATLVVER